MRGERATMGKSLLDVQRELKIKATYIAAIENSDPSVFETPGFIAGYVRSYARFLGLDPEWAFERFCEESGFSGVEGLSGTPAAARAKSASTAIRLAGEDAIIKPVAPYAPTGAGMFSGIEPGAIGSISVMLALIGAIGYGGWSVLQEIQRVEFAPVEQTAGVVAEIDGLQGGTDSTEFADASAGFTAPTPDALDRLYRPQALEAPVLTARDGPIASIDPSITGALADASERLRLAANEPYTPADAPLLPTPPQVIAQAAPDVVLFAVRPAWVRVASPDGTILFEKTLDAGEQYVLPQTDEEPLLRAGNSGALFFNVQGKTYGPAGPGTSVAKNVALGVEAITEVYAEADTTDQLLAETLKAMADTPVETDPDAPLQQ
jgi:cytoskeletal protein RodZ